MNAQVRGWPVSRYVVSVALCCMAFGGYAAIEAAAGVVVMTGDLAPGSGGRTFTTNFTDPRINSLGEIAFAARVSGGSNDGVWYTAAGLVVQDALAIENDSAPGGGTYSSLSTTSIGFNDSGHTAFRIRIGTADGYWSNRTGTVQLIVKEGDAAPGSSPSASFANLNASRIYLNNSGHIAFNDSDLDGVWSESTGSIQLVAGAGVTGPGGIIVENVPHLAYNNNGYCALVADHAAPSLNNNSILSDRTGALQKVIGAGDPVPGGGEHLTLGAHPVQALRFNNSDQIGFQALIDEIVNSVYTNLPAIFVEDTGGALRRVAKEGELLPNGAVAGSPQLRALDDQGMLFYEVNDSLFVYDTNANTNSLVFAKGDAAPETASTFNRFHPAVRRNAMGLLAFRADMADGNAGFWIEQTPGAGDFKLIVAEGQTVEVAPGVFKTIDQIDLNYTYFFNDSGQYAYQVDFTDGTEAIFSGIIPEPATMALLGLGLGVLLVGRKRLVTP